MPEPVIGRPTGAALHGASIGFCGKLPARGDFVGAGLPRRFVEEWHDWMQRMLAASRRALGEHWGPVWNVAPIWRFALSPGICGRDAVLGLWMPSVDRVGRPFPLTVAAATACAGPAGLIRDGGGFLAAAEAAGLDALATDLEPDAVAARLAEDVRSTEGYAGITPELWSCNGALWWSAGRDAVANGAVTFATRGLPDQCMFAWMLQPEKSVGGAGCPRPSS